MRGIFGVIVFILMALPLAWFYVAMYWGFTITKDIAAFERGETVELPVVPPVKWLNGRQQVRTAFSPDEITRGRAVTYRIDVPFAEMLQPGEVMPERDVKELYATLRAAQYFMPICDELLGSLASACRVGSFEADVRHPGDRTSRNALMEYPEDGLALLSATVHYLPAYNMGNPAIVPNGEVESARIKLLDGARVLNTDAGRAELYADAMAFCDGLREVFGNCVIRSITMEPGPARHNDPDDQPRLKAAASFSMMVDKTKYRRKAVQAALDQIAADRLASLEVPDEDPAIPATEQP